MKREHPERRSLGQKVSNCMTTPPVPPSSTAPLYRVVVADDFTDIRVLLSMQLDRDGRFAVVAQASDGVEALAAVEEHQPDVIVLDLMMPRMDGLEVIHRLRVEHPSVRIVVFTGLNPYRFTKATLEAGADRYVEKGPGADLPGVLAEVLASPDVRKAESER
jgi:CheY-like chemotaxis protein